MKLVMVTVPDCPNAPTLERRLLKALNESGARAATIAHRTVSDAGQAARWQMRGSPTLLIDGRDPFADAAMPTGLACRMYRDEQGRLEGAPSVPALVAALVAALRHALDSTRHQALAHTGGPDPNEVVPGSVPMWADARVAPAPGGQLRWKAGCGRCTSRCCAAS
ncbi:hypothetical protein, partial [Nonomuraea sp. NPDC049709]|uniref:hypothetical protein n=1 Tax=Nonomuraea sp. NPDC049709 TaxID=3154736 RepID=UPI0034283F39